MSTAAILKTRLESLKAENFRNGFNHTFEMELCKVLPIELADSFWSDSINFSAKGDRAKIAFMNKWLDGNHSLLELFEEVAEMSKGKGSFEMPSWGTYGT